MAPTRRSTRPRAETPGPSPEAKPPTRRRTKPSAEPPVQAPATKTAGSAQAAAPISATDVGLPPRRRIVITGAAGFIGSRVAGLLRERGDEVVALVRDSRRAERLTDLGVELIESDLSDDAQLREALYGADALIHAAGRYRVGIRKSERGAMWDSNIGTTTRLLDAAEAAGTPRIVYTSTVNVFGDTHGRVVDEDDRRDLGEGFMSWYDETKFGAYEVARQRIARGAPVRIAMPGTAYGPGDHSALGALLERAFRGSLLYGSFPDFGILPVHVDDVASGMVAILDRGVDGRAYAISGEPMRLREAIRIAAAAGGRRPPFVTMPSWMLPLMAPFGPLTASLGLTPPNMADAIRYARVTMWVTNERARRELGWAPRDLATGIRDAFGGLPAASH